MRKPVKPENSSQSASVQDLSQFRLPKGFRGASAFKVQVWWAVQATLFRGSPQFAYGFRSALLRLFGAEVGKKAVIRPSVTVTYPWKVRLGDYVWIGDDVVLYSLGDIQIGNNSVVSQKSYLCAGDHDYTQKNFPIRARSIRIGDECWIAADVFVGPGVTIGDRTVVGARSTVLKDLPAGVVAAGSPCGIRGNRLRNI